jgi:hypothetical protein
MKNTIFVYSLFLGFIGIVPAIGQASDTPLSEPKMEQPKKADTRSKTTTKEPPQKQFKDLNANGIDDAQEQEAGKNRQKMNRKRDRFIDADGDGICDDRASGAGLKRRNRGSESAKQSQPGKK